MLNSQNLGCVATHRRGVGYFCNHVLSYNCENNYYSDHSHSIF